MFRKHSFTPSLLHSCTLFFTHSLTHSHAHGNSKHGPHLAHGVVANNADGFLLLLKPVHTGRKTEAGLVRRAGKPRPSVGGCLTQSLAPTCDRRSQRPRAPPVARIQACKQHKSHHTRKCAQRTQQGRYPSSKRNFCWFNPQQNNKTTKQHTGLGGACAKNHLVAAWLG